MENDAMGEECKRLKREVKSLRYENNDSVRDHPYSSQG